MSGDQAVSLKRERKGFQAKETACAEGLRERSRPSILRTLEEDQRARVGAWGPSVVSSQVLWEATEHF